MLSCTCKTEVLRSRSGSQEKKLKLLDINSDVAIEDINLPDEEEAKQLLPTEIGLLYCNKRFYLERTLKDLDPEERKQQRAVLEQPVWDQFWNWLGTLHPTGGSKLGKAVVYAQNHHDTLMNYLLDGRCEISNNRAERKAKSYAIGRKAFLFHTSEAGAGASAVMYSIVETAKANNLNIFPHRWKKSTAAHWRQMLAAYFINLSMASFRARMAS